MPYNIKFPGLPAGITLSSARKDETGFIQTQGFYSTEDGQIFVDRLEGLVQGILNMVSSQAKTVIAPQVVYQLLLVVRRDLNATLYVNDEFRILATCDPMRGFVVGNQVTTDDIQSFKRLDFDGIELPTDGGVLFLFTIGWRKGLFYDYSGAPEEDVKSNEYIQRDYGPLLGELMNRVVYQNRFRLSEDDWQRLFDCGFFPFYGLRHSLLDKLLAHIRSGWDLREMSDKIYLDVASKVNDWLEAWRKSSLLIPHVKFIETSVERYLACDCISCVSILMPRLEGVLRSHGLRTGSISTKPKSLAQITNDSQDALYDVLLPRKFKDYLRNVFFGNFDQGVEPGDISQPLSRNTIAHGIVSSDQCDKYQASICLLVLHHLARCIDPPAQPLGGPLVKA